MAEKTEKKYPGHKKFYIDTGRGIEEQGNMKRKYEKEYGYPIENKAVQEYLDSRYIRREGQ